MKIGNFQYTVMYHGSPDDLLDLGIDDSIPLHLTDSEHAATGYLRGKPGYLHTVLLPTGLKIADGGDIMRYFEPNRGIEYPWQVLEQLNGREKLEAEGFVGAKFRDLGPENAYDHETIVIWEPASAGLIIQDSTFVDPRK